MASEQVRILYSPIEGEGVGVGLGGSITGSDGVGLGDWTTGVGVNTVDVVNTPVVTNTAEVDTGQRNLYS